MTESSANPMVTNLDQRITKSLHYFWFGFILYAASFSLMAAGISTSSIFAYFQLIGILISIPTAYNVVSYRIENKYLRATFVIYCLWIITVILRGFNLDQVFIVKMIFDAYAGLFLYFVPLVLLFPRNLASVKIVFNAIFALSVIYVSYVIVFSSILFYQGTNDASQDMVEYFSKTLSIPSGFLLLTFVYHTDRRKLWALFVILLTFFLAVIRARRGLMFMTSTIIMFFSIVYYYSNKGKLINKLAPLLLVPFVVYFLVNIYNENKGGQFSLITERIDEDTRTGVELFFYADMEAHEWIIGRGINGLYYCPIGVDDNPYAIPDYRFGVETDYLTIILKGGIISLALLLLIAIPAMIKGIFQSQNLLSKAAGIWILLWMVNLYPTTVTTFTLNYTLVWISIGICYSNEIRNLSDEFLISYFRNDKT